ncbi:MAG TPA: T9SS type A sorting domain-containing protein, partial [Ignavibacteriaceae bacterium]
VKKVNFSGITTSINLFPNPTVDFVTLQVSNSQPTAFIYSVYTIDGKIIKTGGASLNSGSQQIKIDLTQTTAKGMLLIQLKNIATNGTEVFKVMKE